MIPLSLPFISDRVTNEFKRCLIQAQLNQDVVLVNIPANSIKRQLVRNRLYDTDCITQNCVVCPNGRVGDCAKFGVVYELECLDCHATYIGETGRLLSIRVNEHLASKKRGSAVSPVGKHRADHGGNDFCVKCTILAHESKIAARKALEASFILSRQPKMNGKNEHIYHQQSYAVHIVLSVIRYP